MDEEQATLQQGSSDPSRAAFVYVSAEEDAGPSFLGLAVGELGGDPETGCLWIGGAPRTRLLIVTSDQATHVDFTVKPFVVRSGETVVAAEGQKITLTGGLGGPAGVLTHDCPVDGEPFVGRINR